MWSNPDFVIFVFALGSLLLVAGLLGLASEFFPKVYIWGLIIICAIGMALIVIPIVIQSPITLAIIAVFALVLIFLHRQGFLPRIR